MIGAGALTVLAALAGVPAVDALQRRHWDWGQHDTGSGVTRAEPASPAVPWPVPDWDGHDAPVRWARDGAAPGGDAIE
jgi:hypothetical protein